MARKFKDMKESINTEIKNSIKRNNIPMSLLAMYLSVSESTLYRWMRHPLNEKKTKIIMDTIDQLENDER